MSLYLLVMAPIFVALLLYLLPLKFSRVLSLFLQAGIVAFALSLFLQVKNTGDALIAQTGGAGILGIALYSDRTAAVFVLLTTVLFLCMMVYTLTREAKDKLFIFLLVTLQSLVMLIFLSRDLFNIYLSVEVSTMLCAILIMYKRDARSLYDGLVYLLTNTVAMLFFLLGVGMLYRQFGVLDIAVLGNAIAAVKDGKTLVLPFALIMTGVGLKCAFMPVFSWLPKAHGTPGAPSVVSAILSGLYVKASLYLFMRMRDMFAPAIDMDAFFLVVGIITGLGGIILAVSQKDIKLILAYHTISQLGLILIGLTLHNDYAMSGALLHIVNHALFKSLLFLTAGILIAHYKTRNIYEMKGVLKQMPWVGAAILAGILGITGAPLFNGSISKYLIKASGDLAWAEVFIILINVGTVLSFVKYGQILFGKSTEKREKQNATQTGVVLTLAVLCLLTGVLGAQMANVLFGITIVITPIEYVQKALIWAVSMAVGWVLYKYVLAKWAFFKSGPKLELSFNNVCACIVGFFFLILSVGYFTMK